MTDRETMQHALNELQFGSHKLAISILRTRLAQPDWSQPYEPEAWDKEKIRAEVAAACNGAWDQMRRKLAA